ncbi:MAG: hypothetical protein JJU13_03255 [Balneolaceae bacterium]|nr:hypothetical protein [Balneolaceae bacterium]
MKDNPIPVTGILWWKPDQWKKAKQISSDSHIFDDSYQEWKETAENTFNNFQDLSVTVYKIEIDLDEYVEWCKKKKLPLDANARTRYVSLKVKEHHEAQSK